MANPDVKEILCDCVINLRENPKRRRETVYVGCGAGFGGDRPLAALKLLQRVEELNYLVLECLAERTLADRWLSMASGGLGYDPRVSEWMQLLLPLAVERGTCIITNMGAIDPSGAQKKVLEVAGELGLTISVAVAHEVHFETGSGSSFGGQYCSAGGTSTYLGAAPIVECLEKYQPNVIITSRVADAALFLAPMVYELGWNWNDLELLAQGTLAGHLLECGCQLTGGYFMHPGDQYRDMAFPLLQDLSLPYAEIGYDGKVCVSKVEGSGGILNTSTCAEQLLYEIADPSAYITPDVVIDIRGVSFLPLSDCKVQCSGAKPSSNTSVPEKLLRLIPKECGWKGWGEISYGGNGSIQRAKASEFLVRSWMEETIPGVNHCILSYVIGVDSLKATSNGTESWQSCGDIRLRMDGLFKLKEHAVQLTKEFTALYTNGPAGGGGISTGHKMEIVLEKRLVSRESVMWKTGLQHTNTSEPETSEHHSPEKMPKLPKENPKNLTMRGYQSGFHHSPAPSGQKIPLYSVAHSRAGDKGNDINFSIIPHYSPDVERLKLIITPQWVKHVMSVLLSTSSFLELDAKPMDENVSVEIYDVEGIHAMNVVVRNILDGGVNCSRRIDRHGKTISDLILCQQVVLI
ncbi:propionyl-CoA carboxylase [Arabidopsis thaliana]|uniref:Propionyl-CoA carboxylase n=2 Tax=Arabidopsis thaliana TaxID=3702 RepID=Q8GZ85_ARATH|nr:propionyl-CoA carboxylase [Arabidopsis thaliana]AEE27333.1 propionyl-CoA carboxylase [Arabidopsis thaliana]BAC41831.1 unknown protein [Arabidopsis thaliana]|eukprot:NP_171682.2 propionyl-CoA carboxylase [Arabidopsis thaliana]